MKNPIAVLIISALIVLTAICLTSAWPYQINLSNGTLVDLNASNMNTTNLSIYILPQNYTTNITYLNVTNVTWINMTNTTCINCTQQNITWINQTNTTCVNCTYVNNVSGYSQAEANNRFLTITDFGTYKSGLSFPYSSKDDLNYLSQRVDAINATASKDIGSSEVSLWIMVIISILLGAVAIFMAMKANKANENLGGN